MPHLTSTNAKARRHHWRRDLIELAAIFVAVATADLLANLVAHGPDGPVLLCASAAALAATTGFHTWWARRHSHSPPALDHDPALDTDTDADPALTADLGPSLLWRLRTTVRDTPGSLGAVCTALAAHGVDILTLQAHPLAEGTVDEFLLRAPASLAPGGLSRAVTTAGGRDTWVERADTHDLVDTPTRMLNLATRTAMDAAELPLALRQLFGRCSIRSLPADRPGSAPYEEVLEGTVMRLRDPSGGSITVERPYLPFTPTEFARARALVELDARLGVRVPKGRDVLTLPEGNAITIRRAGPEDLAAASAMHGRCSPSTLAQRYHGPVRDTDRYLEHLLSPRFGQTLAVETASGRIVALAHLLWDGDESEVAVLVEDDWQRRGIGVELLRRLTDLAAGAHRDSVYAVTQATNTGMVATMRRLSLPLDYQVEDGTLVITATLSPADAPARTH
ncbi:GNAT family N-acetyltransferase [Actinacidiphila soli]|uniref:GNAT family N-acetyltransferase n=1 Tax=Actinacidiphila soli TaxID=2487275 RepID=UPI000FCC0884|nr:GNAT family N-acetyltransferase [Actinacidiphila soli]